MKQWKQADIDFSPRVVVDENNNYIGTANSPTSARLFIRAHNDAIKPADSNGVWLPVHSGVNLRSGMVLRFGEQEQLILMEGGA